MMSTFWLLSLMVSFEYERAPPGGCTCTARKLEGPHWQAWGGSCGTALASWEPTFPTIAAWRVHTHPSASSGRCPGPEEAAV